MKILASRIKKLLFQHRNLQRYVTVPLLAAAVVANIVIYRLYSQYIEKEFRLESSNLLSISTANLAYSLLTGNVSLTRQQLRMLIQHHNVIQATIYKPDGKIAFRVMKYRYDASDTGRFIKASRPIDGQRTALSAREILDGAIPGATSVIGKLELVLDRTPLRDSLRMAALLSMMIIATGLLITLLLVSRRKSDIEQEIDILEGITTKYARGDYRENPAPPTDSRFTHIHEQIAALGETLRQEVTTTYDNLAVHNERFRDELEQFRNDAQKMADELERLKHDKAFQLSVLQSLDNDIQKGITRSIDLIENIGQERQSLPFAGRLTTIKSQLQLIRHAIRNVCRYDSQMKEDYEHQNLDLRKLIEGTMQITAPLCYDSNNELVLLLYEDVETKLHGPDIAIRDMLIDMISIARNHTANGSIIIRAELEDETDVSVTIGLSVQDDGTGITLETQKKIHALLKTGFPGWKQTDTSIDFPFITLYRTAKAVNARIEFKSMLGEGTTTRISLMLNKQAHVMAKKRHEMKYHAFKCLLYDRHDISRSAINSLLQTVDIETRTTRHREDVSNILNHAHDTNEPYELVILSLCADETKPEAVSEILEGIKNREDYIIVVLVNSVDPMVLHEIKSLDVTHCFPKVVSKDLLISKINSSFVLHGRLRNSNISLQGANILVADDDPVSRKFAVTILGDSGANVTEATNGDEAVLMAASHAYDVILMDVYMPGTNGIEAMRNIRRGTGRSAKSPIVALTSNTIYKKKSSCKKLGFDACLIKPIDSNTLLNETLSLLDLTDSRFHNIDFKAVRKQRLRGQAAGTRLYDVEKALKITGGNIELADELFQSLLEELPGMKERLNTAFNNKDYKDMESAAHKLHGSAAYCAVTSIKDLAARLEKATINNRLDDIVACINELNSGIERILDDASHVT